MIYDITPVAKPRMVKSDKWKKRPAVQRYWAFKQECQLKHLTFPLRGSLIRFGMPMPKSWSEKLKNLMCGKPHETKPDLDNLLKGLGDAVYPQNDSSISRITVEKVWAYDGFIEVKRQST